MPECYTHPSELVVTQNVCVSQGMSQYQLSRWDLYGPTPYFPSVVMPEPSPAAPKVHPIGEVTDFIENEECFKVSTDYKLYYDFPVPVFIVL